MAQLCESCGSHYELEALPEFEDELELEAGELEDELELEDEDELEDEAGLEGEGWLGAIGNVVGSLLGEQELEDELEGAGEFEDETEDELEDELSPIRKIYPDAMMEHLGELAAEAETEQEAAEHFLPLIGMAASKLLPVAAKALAPMARKALPHIAKAVTRVTPHLTRGVGKIARGLHRRPVARPLLKAVPAIARRTVHSIAKQAAHGRKVTPRVAVRTLAHQTRRVLGTPRHRAHALRHHRKMEKHLHRGVGRGIVRPHARYRMVGGRRVLVPHHARRRVRGLHGHPGVVRRGVVHPGVARRGVVHPGVVHPGVVHPGVATHPTHAGAVAVPGRAAGRGRIVGGQCICPACPACGAAVAPGVAVHHAAAPNYCRCCGQLIR
jgi:hypothetical protein